MVDITSIGVLTPWCDVKECNHRLSSAAVTMASLSLVGVSSGEMFVLKSFFVGSVVDHISSCNYGNVNKNNYMLIRCNTYMRSGQYYCWWFVNLAITHLCPAFVKHLLTRSITVHFQLCNTSILDNFVMFAAKLKPTKIKCTHLLIPVCVHLQ